MDVFETFRDGDALVHLHTVSTEFTRCL